MLIWETTMGLAAFGRLLIGIGIFIVLAGLFLIVFGRFGGRLLPGDLVLRSGRVTYFFPLATSVFISVILSLVLTLIARWRR